MPRRSRPILIVASRKIASFVSVVDQGYCLLKGTPRQETSCHLSPLGLHICRYRIELSRVARNFGRKITPVHSLLAFTHLAYPGGRWMTGVEVGTTPFRRYDDAGPPNCERAMSIWTMSILGYGHLGYGEMTMRKTNWVAMLMSLMIGAFLAGSAAKAQPPTPTPPPDYGAPINNEQAKEAAAASIAEARKNGWRMAIAVVDPGGLPRLFRENRRPPKTRRLPWHRLKPARRHSIAVRARCSRISSRQEIRAHELPQ